MTVEKSSFELHLEKLKGEYKAQLPAKLEAIANDWQALCGQWQPDTMVILHRNLHSLIGTSGTFGFSDVSKTARVLEVFLKPLLNEKDPTFKPDLSLIHSVNSSINALKALISPDMNPGKSNKNIVQLDETAADFSDLDKQLTQTKNSGLVAQDILIYYLDSETTAPELLLQNLLSYGFKSKHFRSMDKLVAAVQHKQPSLIILDLMIPSGSLEDFFDAARTFVERGIKVFVFSGKDDFTSRLHSVRAGIHSYVTKPADIPSLVGMIRNHLNLNINKPTHILIVDDQISIAEFYATILEQAGMKVTIETNPYGVLPILQSSMPDLLLLDLNMPDVNGDELAAVVRQQEQFQTIPILFLSANAHPDKKTDLLEIGSDDLLSKGMPPEELVRHVRSRVDRAKILTAMMYQDSLTGLLNHAQIQLAAERVFMQCKRKDTTFTIAMIDIDKFKSVNDTYGHLTGDRVIKALAQLLQQRLRVTDYIGRFGGEEFLLIMPDMNIHDAGNLINSLRKAFSLINFKSDNLSFNVSFSAGIAENTGMNAFIDQIKFADEALYRAKERGRNVVCASMTGDAT
ncbi:diguanylate cyclase [Cellvibrio zantedeschiae]|uniref:diguanylate cyclase n=1 Tax=Cellvibrio zantedeschiae TaxID=1237077 RepID=A0ABQ3ANQ9_9GAMM|nr:diguanylate cyclase [Cellvibrio zantedeschiae]GGY63128.1 diguanylate cyclase [Cellvibrio zantedeschiae]